MAVRRHFVHFIKVFLKFGSFTPMVWNWNLHTFRALFIAMHLHFYFWNKILNMAAKRHFLQFCHLFLLFGAFKAILSKCLSRFFAYWFLELLIQQKCWHQQKIAHVSNFFLSCIFTFQAILSPFVFAGSAKFLVENCWSQLQQKWILKFKTTLSIFFYFLLLLGFRYISKIC